MDFDYKKYSLEKLNEWMHDALSCGEATPQEIYDVIKKVVEENYYTYKYHTGRCYELLALLNGNGIGHIQGYDDYVTDPKGNQVKVCSKDDQSPECQGAWNDFWNDSHSEALTFGEMVSKEDKVVKWQLPVEIDGISGEYYIQFPDDLMEAAGIKEDDLVEWIDRGDGSFELRKVTKPIKMEEC